MANAKSWIPVFEKLLPDIHWWIGVDPRITITDGSAHFVVGANGCLFMSFTKSILKVGHIYEMGAEWAAKLFEDPYTVNFIPKWTNFFKEHQLAQMYQLKLKNDRAYEAEYAIAKQALGEFKLGNPDAQIVVDRWPYDYLPAIYLEIRILSEGQYYKKHLDGSWYRLDDSDPDYPEWYPCTITGEFNQRKGTAYPQWC